MKKDILKDLLAKPGRQYSVSDFDPSFIGELSKQDAKGQLTKNVEKLSELQSMLYAQDRYSILIIFQAMDAAGKDGTIKHVMSGINPQGCQVFSFKQPSAEELDHDYLWRINRCLPERGRIGIFNRSHYEDVLIAKVHSEIILSKAEQKKRFMERLDDKTKNWKFSSADVKERQFWDEYMKAYADVLTETSTELAPWYVIPADNKWFMRYAVGHIICERMKQLDLHYPKLSEEGLKQLEDCKKSVSDINF